MNEFGEAKSIKDDFAERLETLKYRTFSERFLLFYSIVDGFEEAEFLVLDQVIYDLGNARSDSLEDWEKEILVKYVNET